MKKLTPRIGNCYGMKVLPIIQGDTWIEGEMWNTDYGQFKRRAVVRHRFTNQLVFCHADVPDTYFSILAYTNKEHGFITTSETGFLFHPDNDQSRSIKDWKKELRDCYK